MDLAEVADPLGVRYLSQPVTELVHCYGAPRAEHNLVIILDITTVTDLAHVVFHANHFAISTLLGIEKVPLRFLSAINFYFFFLFGVPSSLSL